MTIIDNSLETSKGIEIAQIGFGGALIFIGFGMNYGFSDGYVLMGPFCVVGIFCMVLGIYRYLMNKKAEEYINILKNKSVLTFSEIAKATREDEATVEKTLTWMLNHDFLVNTKINYKEKYIFDKNVMKPQSNVQKPMSSAYGQQRKEVHYETKKEYISAVCDCCGGITMIEVGKGGVCDYCRAPLGKYKNM